MALPDALEGEDVIITFEKEDSGNIYNVEGKMTNWNVSGGAENTEDVYAFGGKTYTFSNPREKFTLEMDVIINDTNLSFIHQGAYDFSQNATAGRDEPNLQSTNKLIMSDKSPGRWRVIFWFQDSDHHAKNATGTVITPSKDHSVYRIICVDVRAVTFDKEYGSEEYMQGTLSLEFSAVSEQGLPNYIEQEGIVNGTTSTELASMTTTAESTTSGNTGLLLNARGYLDWSDTTTPSWTGGTTSTMYRYTG